MNNTGLPPLPPAGAVGPEVCNVIQLYLAVWNDLAPEEAKIVTAHVQQCAECAHEQRVFSRSTRRIAQLEASSPSARVDQAVMMAIAARRKTPVTTASQPVQPIPLVRPIKKPVRRSRGLPLRLGGLVAAAAVMIVGLFAASHFVTLTGSPLHPVTGSAGTTHAPVTSLQAFALPENLSWNGYVLYHSQTMMSTAGEPFKVECYQDLTTGRMNVETTMDNKLDVVTVGDAHEALGMDMMHHVAQWDAHGWQVDGSMFDLKQLRKDLKSGKAVYEGKTIFNGQQVYRIRYSNNDVLLLDMDYMPVNVLQANPAHHTAAPMYDKLQVLPSSKVPGSMWDMSIPQGFKMGSLPQKPVEAND